MKIKGNLNKISDSQFSGSEKKKKTNYSYIEIDGKRIKNVELYGQYLNSVFRDCVGSYVELNLFKRNPLSSKYTLCSLKDDNGNIVRNTIGIFISLGIVLILWPLLLSIPTWLGLAFLNSHVIKIKPSLSTFLMVLGSLNLFVVIQHIRLQFARFNLNLSTGLVLKKTIKFSLIYAFIVLLITATITIFEYYYFPDVQTLLPRFEHNLSNMKDLLGRLHGLSYSTRHETYIPFLLPLIIITLLAFYKVHRASKKST